jgi:hypothetical protein
LIISFIISTSVIATFAVYIINNPGSNELNLEEASIALQKGFGDSSKYIWAVGLLASG